MCWSMHFSSGTAHLEGVEARALLLELALLLQELVVAHGAAAVEGGARALQFLAQDQRLRILTYLHIYVWQSIA